MQRAGDAAAALGLAAQLPDLGLQRVREVRALQGVDEEQVLELGVLDAVGGGPKTLLAVLARFHEAVQRGDHALVAGRHGASFPRMRGAPGSPAHPGAVD
jgi:hypothetical protein